MDSRAARESLDEAEPYLAHGSETPDAEIIILDEPTAALDAQAEYDIFLRFVRLTEGKMAIIISHRFSTVRMADRIAVLDGGTLAELGSHDELMALGGTYAELFELQARGYRE